MVAVGLAAITTEVAVTTGGVFVGGRKGVGGLSGPGWITQPLQDADSSINRNGKMTFFISSPPSDCIPLYYGDNALLLSFQVFRIFIVDVAGKFRAANPPWLTTNRSLGDG